jgi:hypothetical protein
MKLSALAKPLRREVLGKRQPSLVTDWEPNSRGLALEDPINELNRIRWRLQGASQEVP